MVRYVFAAIVMTLTCGCGQQAQDQQAQDKLLTAPEFTEAFIAELCSTDDGISVEREGELDIVVLGAQDEELRMFLDNAYKEYRLAPEGMEDVLERYAQSTLETIHTYGDDSIDIDRVVPIIKDAAFPVESRMSLIEAGYDEDKIDSYCEPLNEHLVVLYAVDTERSIKYLGSDDIESLGLEPGELRRRALKNLNAILPEFERHGDSGTYMVTAGGTYEASLLLVDTIWTTENFAVEGDIVVAVPSRDLLLVTGSKDPDGLKRLHDAANETVQNAVYYLTAKLFVRRNGKWLPFTE